MVANFAAGGAAINQLARLAGAELRVVPVGQGRPAHDFTTRPAMSEAGLPAGDRDRASAPCRTISTCVAIGEMGIANTTPAAAIAAALAGEAGGRWAGPGTGLDRDGVRRKAGRDRSRAEAASRGDDRPAGDIAACRRARACGDVGCGSRRPAAPHTGDARRLHRHRARRPCCRRSSLARPRHCQVGHCSAEPGHRRLLEQIGRRPLLDLGMRLGEASGAAVAIQLARAAVACHTGMATFASAKVDQRDLTLVSRQFAGGGAGGGMTGVLAASASGGGGLTMPGSTPSGGLITPSLCCQLLGCSGRLGRGGGGWGAGSMISGGALGVPAGGGWAGIVA